MRDYPSVGEQIFSGVCIAVWLLLQPVAWGYRLTRWFFCGVTREAGNRILQTVGRGVAALIVGGIVTWLSHFFSIPPAII